jgi:predicted nucleotidyltransferase
MAMSQRSSKAALTISVASVQVPGEVLAVARQVVAIVRRFIADPAYRVFLFGSWATGAARERSDIDIGIEGPAPVDPGAMGEIREACGLLRTLRTVDIVDFSRLARGIRDSAASHVLDLGVL